jgi:hypothetical protein
LQTSQLFLTHPNYFCLTFLPYDSGNPNPISTLRDCTIRLLWLLFVQRRAACTENNAIEELQWAAKTTRCLKSMSQATASQLALVQARFQIAWQQELHLNSLKIAMWFLRTAIVI